MRRFKVLYLGNLSFPKGVDRLIEIAKVLKQMGAYQVVFLVCGEERGKRNPLGRSCMLRELQQSVKEDLLEDMVFFAGFQNNPEMLISCSDVIIRVSRYNDPWGRDVIEGIVGGKPVLATGDNSVFIEEGINGYLFEDFNARKMAEKIVFLAETLKAYQQIAQANLDKGATLFSGEAIARQVSRMYEGLNAHV